MCLCGLSRHRPPCDPCDPQVDYGGSRETLHLAAEEIRLLVGAGEVLTRAPPEALRRGAEQLEKLAKKPPKEDDDPEKRERQSLL